MGKMKFSGITSIHALSFAFSLLATSEIEGFTPATLRQSPLSVECKGFNPFNSIRSPWGKTSTKVEADAEVATEQEPTIAEEVTEATEVAADTPEQKYYARLEARKAAVASALEEKSDAELEEIEAKYNAIEDVSTRLYRVMCDLGIYDEPDDLDEDHPDFWEPDGLDDVMAPIKDSKGNPITEWP